MDLPLCKICGERHRLGFCPKYRDPADARRSWLKAMTPQKVTDGKRDLSELRQDRQAAAPAVGHQPHVHPVPPLSDGHPDREGKPQREAATGKFDKRAYQRELMRKRRAAAREAIDAAIEKVSDLQAAIDPRPPS